MVHARDFVVVVFFRKPCDFCCVCRQYFSDKNKNFLLSFADLFIINANLNKLLDIGLVYVKRTGFQVLCLCVVC